MAGISDGSFERKEESRNQDVNSIPIDFPQVDFGSNQLTNAWWNDRITKLFQLQLRIRSNETFPVQFIPIDLHEHGWNWIVIFRVYRWESGAGWAFSTFPLVCFVVLLPFWLQQITTLLIEIAASLATASHTHQDEWLLDYSKWWNFSPNIVSQCSSTNNLLWRMRMVFLFSTKFATFFFVFFRFVCPCFLFAVCSVDRCTMQCNCMLFSNKYKCRYRFEKHSNFFYNQTKRLAVGSSWGILLQVFFSPEFCYLF